VIECRVAAGDVVEATDASRRLRRLADTVATPYADALACRGAALVAHASGDTVAAIDHARRAIAGFASPFDAARTELLLGDAHRRAGERRLAAEAIGRAAACFGKLGAHMWQRRAETELRRASPRARDRHELTAAEERVAALVAAGRANKEVAAELFTTVATVEAHLTRIYRKLGVRSRSELARGVADGSITFAEK
jgi:DNA-binding NarL/FixJ family response regulator